VHADDGLDELSTIGPTRIAELHDGHIRSWTLNPRDVGLPNARISDLQVADAEASAGVIREIAAGKAGPHRDITVLNAAGALVVAGAVRSLPEGIARANHAIASGAAKATLENLARLTNG
jgi:anthranilate phosphoribosyltransferase